MPSACWPKGASGYIMKQAATDQLVTALRTVLRGERFVSEALQQQPGARAGSKTAASSRGCRRANCR